MTIGIGEVPGVDPERAHVGGCRERAAGGFGLPEQLVNLGLRSGRDTQAELGRAERPRRQAGGLSRLARSYSMSIRPPSRVKMAMGPSAPETLSWNSWPAMPSVGQPRPSR